MEFILTVLILFYYLLLGLLYALYWRPHTSKIAAFLFVVLWPLYVTVVTIIKLSDIIYPNQDNNK